MALILVFHNDATASIDSGLGHYNVEVLVGDGTREGSRTIAQGRVENHTRSDGWEALVQKFLHEWDAVRTGLPR
jgi:hypothetical protein